MHTNSQESARLTPYKGTHFIPGPGGMTMPNEKMRAKHIRDIIYSPYTLSEKKALSAFLDAYILCEALAHKVISYHYKDTGRQYEGKTLHIHTLKSALNFYRVDFEDTDKVFSTHRKYKRHHMTPRKLRNNYVHRRPVNDAEEIIERNDVLIGDMQGFIHAIFDLFSHH